MVYQLNVIYLLICLQQGTLYGKICDIADKTAEDLIQDHKRCTVYNVGRPNPHATNLCLQFYYSHHLPRSNDDMVHNNTHNELTVIQIQILVQFIYNAFY